MSIHNQSTCQVISKRVACAGIYRQFCGGAQQVGTVNVGEKGINVGEFLRCHVRYIKLHKIKFYILKAISISRHSSDTSQINQIMELLNTLHHAVFRHRALLYEKAVNTVIFFNYTAKC
jgi:hypothetical protein